jgi:hypothetical protein
MLFEILLCSLYGFAKLDFLQPLIVSLVMQAHSLEKVFELRTAVFH